MCKSQSPEDEQSILFETSIIFVTCFVLFVVLKKMTQILEILFKGEKWWHTIIRFLSLLSSLLVTKDQINPMVEILWDVIALQCFPTLPTKINLIWRKITIIIVTSSCPGHEAKSIPFNLSQLPGEYTASGCKGFFKLDINLYPRRYPFIPLDEEQQL